MNRKTTILSRSEMTHCDFFKYNCVFVSGNNNSQINQYLQKNKKNYLQVPIIPCLIIYGRFQVLNLPGGWKFINIIAHFLWFPSGIKRFSVRIHFILVFLLNLSQTMKFYYSICFVLVFLLPVIHLFHISYFLHLAFFNHLKRKSIYFSNVEHSFDQKYLQGKEVIFVQK